MQRKINEYSMRKETSNKTLSLSVTKVQKTMSNVSAPNNPISDPLPTSIYHDQVEKKCFTVYPLIWTKELYEKFKSKNS